MPGWRRCVTYKTRCVLSVPLLYGNLQPLGKSQRRACAWSRCPTCAYWIWQRGDAELVDKFIQFERKRLAKRAADKTASEKGLARLRAVSELASGIGEGEVP